MKKKLRLAIAGLGTVGCATLRQLRVRSEEMARVCERKVAVVAVSARERGKERGVSLDGIDWCEDALALAARDDVDLVVELIGGHEGVALDLMEASLAAGKHVVTANKAACAHHGVSLARLAESRGVQLRFEAGIAGGIPVVKIVREALSGNQIHEARGILNGTCNYILSSMTAEGRTYEEALREAQRLGYAEADPGLDVDGLDAAHKLALLSGLAFRHRPCLDAVRVEGIDRVTQEDIGFAREFGCEIRLLATARRFVHKSEQVVEQWVRPALIGRDSLLAHIQDARNGISLRGDFGGNLFLAGDGAGGVATASAVVADILDVACGREVFPLGAPLDALPECPPAPEDGEGQFYLRVHAADRPGSMAKIAEGLARADISIEKIAQPGAANAHPSHLPVVLLTHETGEKRMREAVASLAQERDVVASSLLLRVEAR